MTTPANTFRIRIAGGSWIGPAAGTGPGVLSHGEIDFPRPNFLTGLGTPTGAFGKPTAMLSFPMLTQTQYTQLQSLWDTGPTAQRYQNIEVEMYDYTNDAWETWTGYALEPSKPTKIDKDGSGNNRFHGVKVQIKGMVAT